MQRTDDILGVNRLPNENTKKLMAKKLETDTGAVTLMSEICLKVNNAKDKSKKLRVLRENDSQALRQILKGAFDPKIKWSLPLEGGPIPYKPNDAPIGTEHTILLQEARTLFRFIDGGDDLVSHSTASLALTCYLHKGDEVGLELGYTHHVNTTFNYFSGYLVQ